MSDKGEGRRGRGGKGRSGGGAHSRRSRFGRSRDERGKAGFDWSAAEEPYDDEAPSYPDRGSAEDEGPRETHARRRRTLMDLCTPIIGFASMLPAESADPQPDYDQFRGEVVEAIKRLQDQAGPNGIEDEDARQAAYALCFFIDGRVAESEWNAKAQWAAEPLGIMMQQDPEGGVNFFKRLDALGERQKAVREIFLVCLALGYRGKYAELEITEQARRLGEIRQQLVRKIHPTPMEKRPELFPEGYIPADSIEDDVPPPPRWWIPTSIGIVVGALLVYVLLFVFAGRISKDDNLEAERLLRQDTSYGEVIR